MKPNLISIYKYLHKKNTIFNVCTIHNHVLKQIAIDLDCPFARITNYQMLKSNFCVIFNSSIWKVSTTNHFCDEFLSLPTFKVDSESVFPAKKSIFFLKKKQVFPHQWFAGTRNIKKREPPVGKR